MQEEVQVHGVELVEQSLAALLAGQELHSSKNLVLGAQLYWLSIFNLC